MVLKKKVPRIPFQKCLCWIIQSRTLANHLLRGIKKVGVAMGSFLQKFYLWLDFLYDTYAYNSINMQMDTVYLLLCARHALSWHLFCKKNSSVEQCLYLKNTIKLCDLTIPFAHVFKKGPTISNWRKTHPWFLKQSVYVPLFKYVTNLHQPLGLLLSASMLMWQHTNLIALRSAWLAFKCVSSRTFSFIWECILFIKQTFF